MTTMEITREQRVELRGIRWREERMGKIKNEERKPRGRKERLSKGKGREVLPSTWINEDTLVFILGVFDEPIVKSRV